MTAASACGCMRNRAASSGVNGPPCELQTSQRCLGEPARIGRVGGAEKAFGRNVEPDRFGDLRAEVR